HVVAVAPGDPVVGGVEVGAGVLAAAEVVPVPRGPAVVVPADLLELEARRLAELRGQLDDRRLGAESGGPVDDADRSAGQGVGQGLQHRRGVGWHGSTVRRTPRGPRWHSLTVSASFGSGTLDPRMPALATTDDPRDGVRHRRLQRPGADAPDL